MLFPVSISPIAHTSFIAGPILLGVKTPTFEGGRSSSSVSDEGLLYPDVAAGGDWKELPRHRDEEQVQLDVNRSFIYYPNSMSACIGH